MIENFFLFSGMNRDSNRFSLEEVFTSWPGSSTKIISMGDEEDAYLFSMQLMLGSMEIIPFQKFHDDFWIVNDRQRTGYKYEKLQDYMKTFVFCTDPEFLDYMLDYQGDLRWAKKKREKAHWSEPKAQLCILDGFY